MGRFLRKLTDFLTLNFWGEISEKETPKWVKRQAQSFYNKRGVRPYDKVIFLKGDTFVYRVWFEMVGQGQINWHYYKKLRTG